MNRRKSNIVVLILLCLGGFGFLYTLITSPGSLLVQAGMIFLFIGVFYLIYRFFIRQRMGGKDQSAYLRAAKQSKRRFNDQSHRKTQVLRVGSTKKVSSPTPKKSNVSSINKKRKNTHLTVIDGKKGKKKNRAFF